MTNTITLARDLHSEMRSIIDSRNQYANVSHDQLTRGLLTDLGAKSAFDAGARTHRWQERAAAVLERAQTAAQEARAAKNAALRSLVQPAVKGTDAQLLFEMQTARAWARQQRILDTLPSSQRINRALTMLREATEPVERAALLAELPSYLTAAGTQDPQKIIDAVVLQTVPEAQEHATRTAGAERLLAVVQRNVEVVEGALTNYHPLPSYFEEQFIDPEPIVARTASEFKSVLDKAPTIGGDHNIVSVSTTPAGAA